MATFRWAIEVGCRRILVSSRIRFWYFRETRRKHFCNLTIMGIKS